MRLQIPILGIIIPNMGIENSKKPISMLSALFGSTRQQVIGILFGQPGRKFFATEVIRMAGKGSGAVQRELASLVESGLVQTESVGKQKYYQANPASPIFSELSSIALKTTGLSEPLKQALEALSGRIDYAFIYGSVAKGEARAESDVDLLVISDNVSLEEIYAALNPVEQVLSRRINPTLYTSSEFKDRIKSRSPFIEKVVAGKTIALLGDINDFELTR